MNDRERILTLLRGGTPDRVPWLGDLTYWAGAMEKRGEVPSGFQRHPAYYQFHRELGVGFYLQGYEPFRALYDETVRITNWWEGNQYFTRVQTPVGEISERQNYLPASYASALSMRFIKTPDDLRVLRYWREHTRYEPDYGEAARRQELVRELGVTLCYLPKSPFMQLVAKLAGIRAIVDLWLSAPEELEETLALMERNSDEAAQLALDSPAECLMIPENLSSEVVGKRFYLRYVRPYEQKWVRRIQAAGKHSFIHMDGTLKGLLREVGETGFRVIEAATPAPVGDVAMGEMRALAGPGPILWGGLPGIYFTPLVEESEFERLVREVLEVMRREPRYVLGVADQVPPDGTRERVARVVELTEGYGRY